MEIPAALVIDANILFSFFQPDSGRRRLIKRLSTDGCHLVSPDYVLVELTNEKDRISRFANISEVEFTFLLSLLERTVTTVEQDQYHDHFEDAKMLAPHRKDVPYFGLALNSDLPIWSDEYAFRNQDSVPIFTTQQLFSIYEE